MDKALIERAIESAKTRIYKLCDDERYAPTSGHLRKIEKQKEVAEVTVMALERMLIHGEWTHTGYGGEWECSNCKSQMALSDDTNSHPNFCPNCGADMRKGGAE